MFVLIFPADYTLSSWSSGKKDKDEKEISTYWNLEGELTSGELQQEKRYISFVGNIWKSVIQ